MENTSEYGGPKKSKNFSRKSTMLKRKKTLKPSDSKSSHSHHGRRDSSGELKYTCKNIVPLPMFPKKLLHEREEIHKKLPVNIKNAKMYDLGQLFEQTPVFEGPLIDFDAKEPLEESKWNKVSQLILNSSCGNSLKLIQTYKTSIETRDEKAYIPFQYEQVKAEKKNCFKLNDTVEKIEIKKKKIKRKKVVQQDNIYTRYRDRIENKDKNSLESPQQELVDVPLKAFTQQNTDIKPNREISNTSMKLDRSKTIMSGKNVNFSLESTMSKISKNSISKALKSSKMLEPIMTKMRLLKASRNMDTKLHNNIGTRELVQESYFNDILLEKSNKSFIKIKNFNSNSDKYLFEASNVSDKSTRSKKTPKRYLDNKKIAKLSTKKFKKLKGAKVAKLAEKLRASSQISKNIHSTQLTIKNRDQDCYSGLSGKLSRLSPCKFTYVSTRKRSISNNANLSRTRLAPITRGESPYKD
ncbi:unnamed protein product [Moneuplotes crassus]|uniref:Uncharacterized protein n=1 Tax=Euplotes crassus TaxID=5936 RepID=A0AAD1UG31_EUPCR|nr:unnamed protein product [Moneuplotes crassus]